MITILDRQDLNTLVFNSLQFKMSKNFDNYNNFIDFDAYNKLSKSFFPFQQPLFLTSVLVCS